MNLYPARLQDVEHPLAPCAPDWAERQEWTRAMEAMEDLDL